MQQELLQAIPEWEAQHGTQFTIDGEAFLPILYELVGDAAAQAGGSAGAAKKRARTASIQSDLSSHGNPPLSSSVAHNRVAATPMRGVPATPMTTNKRARVAPPSSVRPAAMAPPATTARAPSRIAVPSTAGQSRIARPGAAGTARPAPASTAKIRAPSNFRPRPSASLRAYVDCGGGRRSAEGADSFASLSAARTASHSGTGAMRAPDRSAAHFSSASAQIALGFPLPPRIGACSVTQRRLHLFLPLRLLSYTLALPHPIPSLYHTLRRICCERPRAQSLVRSVCRSAGLV